MNFKAILASVICACMLTSGALAFTPYVPEAGTSNETESQETTVTDGETSDGAETEKAPTTSFLRRDEYYYQAFLQILDVYVNEQLYDCTKEEVVSKMLQKILKENPQYFEFFVSNMLATMDPYSSYHEASSYFLDVENASKGYGIALEEKDDGIYISKILANSNALTCGLQSGDKLISVAGYNTEKLTINAAMLLLKLPYVFALDKGEDGKYTNYNPPVDIEVMRDGEKLSFNLQRGNMTVDQISSSVLDDGKTAYIQIASFLGTDMDKEFNDLIHDYEKQGIKHLTIDLRDNGGGSLDYALSMAETFLAKDELMCYYNSRKLEEPTPIYSTTEKASFDSVSLLVNGNTASAAELFTNILRTKGIAKTVGSRTFGKAVGQTVYNLANGDYITITSYEMLDINKENYNETGIVPDISIEDVELIYTLPNLEIFNHQNYTDIREGEYSKACLALEQRLCVMDLLHEKDADGIFDAATSNALKIYQRYIGINVTGNVTYETVTKLTDTINSYKNNTTFDNTQYDVAMMVHRSFSQAKRLASEKEQLREENKKLIEERDKAILDALDKAEAQSK